MKGESKYKSMERGKHICKTLKEVRCQIAQANDIPYKPTECHHKGDCPGTCPKCEQEVMYIESQLSMRRTLGKAVSVVGISVGLAALSSCAKVLSIFGGNTNGYLTDNDTTSNIPASRLTPEEPAEKTKSPSSMVVNTDTTTKEDKDTVSREWILGDIIETPPSFPGGQAKLLEYISNEVKYPDSARKDSIQGRVVISFVVERNGAISEAKVAKPVHPLLDEEALRAVNAMPKWQPRRINGNTTRVRYNIPITFKMD